MPVVHVHPLIEVVKALYNAEPPADDHLCEAVITSMAEHAYVAAHLTQGLLATPEYQCEAELAEGVCLGC